MKKVVYKLSRIVNEDSKCEVIIKLTIPQSRPCFKTGIFIKKEWAESPKYDEFTSFKSFRRGRISQEYLEAQKAIDAIDSLASRLLKLCQVAETLDKSLLTKEWLESCLTKYKSLRLENLTVEKMKEEDMRLQKEQAESSRRGNTKNYLVLGEEYIRSRRCGLQNKKAFRSFLRDLHRFELFTKKIKNRNFEIDMDTMNRKTVEDFHNFLRTEYLLVQKYPKIYAQIMKICPLEICAACRSPRVKQRADNTIIKLMKKLRAFFNWLNGEQITTNNPMVGYDIGTERFGAPIYLTTEERDHIASFDLSYSPRLETMRDIFIVQCLVGCRVGDFLKLTRSNIVESNSNGKLVRYLSYMPHKTKDNPNSIEAIVPLTDTVWNILQKYWPESDTAPLLPVISAQKYNVAIKEIFRECGITRMVSVRNGITGEFELKSIDTIASSHMCRKTFIGAAYKEVRDPNIICKMSGHVEGSKAFCRYRNIDNEVLIDVIDKIDIKKTNTSLSNGDSSDTDIMSLFKSMSTQDKKELFIQMQKSLFESLL